MGMINAYVLKINARVAVGLVTRIHEGLVNPISQPRGEGEPGVRIPEHNA
jgi:hypothetical protein